MPNSFFRNSVDAQQLADFSKKTKITSLSPLGFKPDNKAVTWRCRRSHKWISSYIDAQVHGCPKCFTKGLNKYSLEVLAKNFKEVNDTLVTLGRLSRHFQQYGLPQAGLGHDAYYHIHFAELLFVGIHLETWIGVRQATDKAPGMVNWKKQITKKCCKRPDTVERNTTEKIRAISSALAKNMGKLGLSKQGERTLKGRLRTWAKRCQFCVDLRNLLAHGTSNLPFKNGKLNVGAFIFIRQLGPQELSDFYDEVRKFMDLGDIILRIGEYRGNKLQARKSRASYKMVALAQIQSLFGVV